ncbi:MAG TPA: MFS transporter [Anaerovoracaceae bacterium]|nr:MFS transporter [Anaerovoracaceae bacterium]
MSKLNYKWIALSCTSLGALFSVLNGSTLIIALPVIMKDLNADMGVIMWTVMIYMLSLTILVPSIGRVADIIGRKKMFVSGFIIFTIGSVLCGFSQTGMQLLIFRFIQSVGGSLLVANSAPIVTDAFPKKELGRAMGINGMIISVASVIGPVLGGLFIQFGWRYIFYINLPIGVIGTIWSILQLKELDVLPAGQKFDWSGTLAFTLGMTGMLLALTVGSLGSWSPFVIALFIVSAAFLALFFFIENRTDQPMLDLELFRTRVLAFAFGSSLLNGIARGAIMFLLIFFYQGIKAIDPLMAAILLTPFAVSMMISAPISGWLSDRVGARYLSSIGLLVSALGMIGMLKITVDSTVFELGVWMFISGFGSGMFFSPNTSSIMRAVPVERRGIAAGVNSMMINAGNVISLAFSMAVISSSIDPSAMQRLFIGTQVGSEGIAVNEFIAGLRLVFIISFIISLLSSLMSFLRGPQPKWDKKANNELA